MTVAGKELITLGMVSGPNSGRVPAHVQANGPEGDDLRAHFAPFRAPLPLPLNTAEPVLPIRGTANDRNLGFAPLGAGRNMSPKAHRRALGEHSEQAVFAAETAGLDARFWSGHIDVSELPRAYKPAATVRAQKARHGLAEVVDEIHPFGCIMAGDREREPPRRKRVDAKAHADAGQAA